MSDMTNFEVAVDRVILDSERLHKVINGSPVDTVTVEDGSEIPSLRKALADNLYFKTPAMPWVPGTVSTVFNQLYSFRSVIGVQWWYAPMATAESPVSLPVDPTNNVNWRLYLDGATMAAMYAPLDSPILKGNPTAPTALQTNDSTTIANTAFVKIAIRNALDNFTGALVNMHSLTVAGMTTTGTLAVTSVSTFGGSMTLNGVGLYAENATGRFENLVLTKELSSVSFTHQDLANPFFLRTRLTPYTAQAHQIQSDILMVGTPTIDNTTMSLRSIGNALMDYVYIRGNTGKPVNEPRLVVDGTTRVQNLEITGTVSGLTFSVDGQTIRPAVVETTQGVVVGTDLLVNGLSDLQNVNAEDLHLDGTINVVGRTTMRGGFTTETGNGTVGGALNVLGTTTLTGATSIAGAVSMTSTLTVEGLLSAIGGLGVTGNITSSANITALGNLTITGDATLNANSTGTTKVHNLEISGAVTGLVIDLTGENIVAQSLTTTGGVSANNLQVSGLSSLGKVIFAFAESAGVDVASSTAAWSPTGEANVYTVNVDANLTIGAWPDVDDPDPDNKPEAFTAMIYLMQGATGHTVTLDPSYFVLNNATEISTGPNDVSILKLQYPGVGDVVDVTIQNRKAQKGVTGGISWTKMNGIVEQWGEATVPVAGTVSVTLPEAMPSADFVVLVSATDATDGFVAVGNPVSATEIEVKLFKQGATDLEAAAGKVYFTVKSKFA